MKQGIIDDYRFEISDPMREVKKEDSQLSSRSEKALLLNLLSSEGWLQISCPISLSAICSVS
jgi:hypothetical protein